MRNVDFSFDGHMFWSFFDLNFEFVSYFGFLISNLLNYLV